MCLFVICLFVDTLGLPELSVSPTDPTKLQAGLSPSSTLSMSAATSLLTPVGSCSGVRYLCARIAEGTNAGFIDADASNNWKCQAMADRRRCLPGEYQECVQ